MQGGETQPQSTETGGAEGAGVNQSNSEIVDLYYQIKNSGGPDGNAMPGQPMGRYGTMYNDEYSTNDVDYMSQGMANHRMLYDSMRELKMMGQEPGSDPYDNAGRLNMMPSMDMRSGSVHGSSNMYHAAPRPSLRSQREQLANQAKQMPRVTGVHFEKKSPAWVANWKECGMKKRIWFRVSEYGMDEAHRRAVEARRAAEMQLPKKDRTVRKDRRRQTEQDYAEQLKALPRLLGQPPGSQDPSGGSSMMGDPMSMYSNMDRGHPHPGGMKHGSNDNSQMDKRRGVDNPMTSMFYETTTHSWIVSWTTPTMTRVRRFPTSKYGFDEAYRLAVQRKNRPMNMKDDQDEKDEDIPVKPNEPIQDAYAPESRAESIPVDGNPNSVTYVLPANGNTIHEANSGLGNPSALTVNDCRALTTECLIDLRERVLPSMRNSHEAGQQPEVMVDYHLEAIHHSTTEHELRPYVTLFNECLVNRQLPSGTTAESQQSMLHTLSLLMTLTKLLKEHTNPADGNASAEAGEGDSLPTQNGVESSCQPSTGALPTICADQHDSAIAESIHPSRENFSRLDGFNDSAAKTGLISKIAETQVKETKQSNPVSEGISSSSVPPEPCPKSLPHEPTAQERAWLTRA